MPPEPGRIVALGLAREAAAPIEPQAWVDLAAGIGVAGDRYARGVGTWEGWPDREVTLVEAETADALRIDALALRRNVVTRGVPLATLEGRRFRAGTAILEGVRPCDPCAHLERLTRRPGLLQALAGRGGLRARVVDAGRVAVGDAVEPLR